MLQNSNNCAQLSVVNVVIVNGKFHAYQYRLISLSILDMKC